MSKAAAPKTRNNLPALPRGQTRRTQDGRSAKVPRNRSRYPSTLPSNLPYKLEHILEMKLHGWSERQIGAYYGKAGPTIHEKLKKAKELCRWLDGEVLEAYRKHRIDLFTAAEWKILSSMLEDDKLEKASGNNLGYMFTQIYQARRLEVGQSTSNIALHEIVEAMEREGSEKKRPSLAEGEPDEDLGGNERG